jgi:hypothetical protein
LSLLEEGSTKERVTEEDVLRAKEVLKKAQEQNMNTDIIQGFNLR